MGIGLVPVARQRRATGFFAHVFARGYPQRREDTPAGKRWIDAINGYVVAQSRDVAVPVNETLTALVRAWESG